MRTSVVTALLAGAAAAATAGCYLSHERRTGRDGGASDAGRDASDDGGRDARVPDAGPVACDTLVPAETLALGEDSASAVTPRLAVLPGGDLALVYVETEGSPTRVIYERLSPRLDRRTGRVIVTDRAFTWAEPAPLADGTVAIAYGTGADASVIQRVSLDGAPRDRTDGIALEHPSIFRPTAGGLFWLAFRMRDTNALQLAHLDPGGAPFHAPVTIELGRYGSGHGATLLRDGRTHVVAYPREGPPGVRRGHVTSIDQDGTLGPERQLGSGDARAVLPVWHGDELVLVRYGDALVLERIDPVTLATIDESASPPPAAHPLAATAADRLVVVHATFALHADDFGRDRRLASTLVVPFPAGATLGSLTSIVSLSDAVVVALTLNRDIRSFPWLVRIECAR